MCDDFIHQGLTHDPTVSRRAFVVGSAATVMLTSASAAVQAKVVEKETGRA
jgi:carboxymethylenebutenolidase